MYGTGVRGISSKHVQQRRGQATANNTRHDTGVQLAPGRALLFSLYWPGNGMSSALFFNTLSSGSNQYRPGLRSRYRGERERL